MSSSCALFNDNEGRWPFQAFPHLKELPPHAVCEQGRDISAGIKVAFPTEFWTVGHIVAMSRCVESHAHILGEGDRTFALNALNDELL